MILGELIEALDACPDHFATVEINGQPPGLFDSYRGYYDQLALGTGQEAMKVAQLLAAARAAVGREYEGYKGGEYVMSEDTPVWFAEYGSWPGEAILSVNAEADPVQIITADISDYA